MIPELHTVQEVAEKLHRTPGWVRLQIKAGRLKALKAGHWLVFADSVNQYLGLRQRRSHQYNRSDLDGENLARARLGMPPLDQPTERELA